MQKYLASADELFMQSEPRSGERHSDRVGAQVFARDRRLPPEAPLVFLERGHADDLRADARAGLLICPIGDCSDPRFVVRAGSRRDHFAHKAGAGGHAAETLAHHTSKHLVAAWLRQLYPDAATSVDTQEVENGQRPDVLIVLADGRKVAYEVQFAGLTQDEWNSRHDGYAGLGVHDVWLFGGTRYDRRPRGRYAGPHDVALPPVFDAVLAKRHPMLLVDPSTETVALGTGPAVDERLTAAGQRPDALRQLAPIATVERRIPIGDARAAGGVIDMPGLRELMQKTEAGHEAWIARVEVQDAERARLEQERLEAAERQAEREAEAAAARRARVEARERRMASAIVDPKDVRRPSPPSTRQPRAPTGWDGGASAPLIPSFLWATAPPPPDEPRTSSAVQKRYPEFAAWSAQQMWPVWPDLPAHLHESARVTAYVARELSIGGDIASLPLGDATVADAELVLRALEDGGLITIEDYAPGHRRWRAVPRAGRAP